MHDAKEALEWADLIYAIDLNGMNSSITPLSLVVQRDRPEKWLNWHAARVLDMIKGSYVFEKDVKRIIQDPESLRASSIRQASTWRRRSCSASTSRAGRTATASTASSCPMPIGIRTRWPTGWKASWSRSATWTSP